MLGDGLIVQALIAGLVVCRSGLLLAMMKTMLAKSEEEWTLVRIMRNNYE